MLRKAGSLAGLGAPDDPYNLAVRGLVARHGGTLQDGKRRLNSSAGGGRQIHKVGGSKTHQKNSMELQLPSSLSR